MKAESPLSESWAFAYCTIPFKDRGAGWEGCDCWSLVRLIYRTRLDILLPDYPEIGIGDDAAKFRKIIRESQGAEWDEIPAGAEQAYDVVLMRGIVEVDGRRAGRPIHVGCVIRPGRLIHTEEKTGVSIIDYRSHPSIKHRVIAFYRYHGEAAPA